MWIAGKDWDRGAAIEQMARLIGSDIPEAKFGTWGREGTGVRLAPPLTKTGPSAPFKHCGLRHQGWTDDLLWILFRRGSKSLGTLRIRTETVKSDPGAKKARTFGTLAQTGSFCEISRSAPTAKRSGDLVREIKRRGWFHGSDGKWYRAAMNDLDDENPPKAGKKASKADPNQVTSNARITWTTLPAEGWMSMATGWNGIPFSFEATNRKPATEGTKGRSFA